MRIPNYKGFEIDVIREESQVGEALFSSVTRNHDGYLYMEEIDYDSKMLIREKIFKLKKMIDNEINDN